MRLTAVVVVVVASLIVASSGGAQGGEGVTVNFIPADVPQVMASSEFVAGPVYASDRVVAAATASAVYIWHVPGSRVRAFHLGDRGVKDLCAHGGRIYVATERGLVAIQYDEERARIMEFGAAAPVALSRLVKSASGVVALGGDKLYLVDDQKMAVVALAPLPSSLNAESVLGAAVVDDVLALADGQSLFFLTPNSLGANTSEGKSWVRKVLPVADFRGIGMTNGLLYVYGETRIIVLTKSGEHLKTLPVAQGRRLQAAYYDSSSHFYAFSDGTTEIYDMDSAQAVHAYLPSGALIGSDLAYDRETQVVVVRASRGLRVFRL